ncbi:hypothetical protein [Oceanicola sp. 502str15]|uniref:hypothetical protein n=1 Tax=Oceanicola sp. 502str15 TaxID=2696061 RepID=UPI0020951E02|nr:hypothetical protein [Oceanicola sp. 502str15]MCO6382891.1 hypothetical protein [Oceanicola sp. 502str15]
MRKALILLPFLAACQSTTGGAPAGYAVADPPIPQKVMSAIPADLRLDQIVVRDGCYYMFYEGAIYPITTQEMRDAGFDGQPYCIG